MSFSVSRSLLVLIACTGASLAAQSPRMAGPSRGSLVLQGGIEFNHTIDSAFVALAGGPASQIVVIPTASVDDAGPPGMTTRLARRMKEAWGVGGVTVLHAIDLNRASADSDAFVEPLRKATGVWILGGFPERMVKAYLGTKTERAIKDLLDRGGVVGGGSAGALIQASWLDTTDDEFSPSVRALIRQHGAGGFGLLTNAAIFPHFDKRGSAAAIAESAAHPNQLAIGIDENTALVVRGETAEVIGLGTVSVYDATNHGASNPITLRNGDEVRPRRAPQEVIAISSHFAGNRRCAPVPPSRY